MNNYESDQEMAGENKKTTSGHNRKGFSRRVKYDHRFRISEIKKQRNRKIYRG